LKLHHWIEVPLKVTAPLGPTLVLHAIGVFENPDQPESAIA
jgi:hypothetical protein